MEEKIKQYLENYRTGKTSLVSREIAKLILSDIRAALPKMEEAIPNANKKYDVSFEELSLYRNKNMKVVCGDGKIV